MDVHALNDTEFEQLTEEVLQLYIQYCQEILYDQDRFMFRKLAALSRSPIHNLQIALSDLDALEDPPDYAGGLDASYYMAVVSYTSPAPAAENSDQEEPGEQRLDVARLVLSSDPERERFVEFLLS